MLLGFFKTNQTLPNFIIPFVAAILWIQAFFGANIVMPADAMPLYSITANALSQLPPFVSALIGVLIVAFQAIYFNYIINKHEVLFRKSNVPLIMYVILISLSKSFLSINPILFTNTLLLIILDRTFNLYKNSSPLSMIFDIWMLLAIASLFYYPVIILLLLLWISLFILRPFIWREWIVGIFGFLVPYLFLCLYYFWNDKLMSFLGVIAWNFNFFFQVKFTLSTVDKVLLALVGLFFLFSLVKMQASFYKNVIRTRGFQQVLASMLVVSSFSFLLDNEVYFYDFTITVIPLSFFISYYFLAMKKTFWAELFFLVLAGTVIYNHFS
jgi:hypothetical protein